MAVQLVITLHFALWVILFNRSRTYLLTYSMEHSPS